MCQLVSLTGRMPTGTSSHYICVSRLTVVACSTPQLTPDMPRWLTYFTQPSARLGLRLMSAIRSSIPFRLHRLSRGRRKSSRQLRWQGPRRKASWQVPSQSSTQRLERETKVVMKVLLKTMVNCQPLDRSALTKPQLMRPRKLSVRREMKFAASSAKRTRGLVVASKLALIKQRMSEMLIVTSLRRLP